MGVVVHFDVSRGVTLAGLRSALGALARSAGAPCEPSAETLERAGKLLAESGIEDFDREGMREVLAALASLGPEAVSVSPFPTGGRVFVKGALYRAGEGVAQPEAAALLAAAATYGEGAGFLLESSEAVEGEVAVLLGRSAGGDITRLIVLEANVDDMTGELLATLPGALLEAGALDAWLTPIIMKKGRPAHTVSALCEAGAAGEVERALFFHSTTIGVRRYEVTRRAASREMRAVETPWGPVRVKVALLDGIEVNGAPEFADCEKAAREGGVPVKEVYASALAAWGARER